LKKPSKMSEYLFGRKPVLEALKAGRSLNKVLFLKGSRGMEELLKLAKEKRIVFDFIDRKQLDKLSLHQNHQGVVAFAASHEYSTVEDILSRANAADELPFLIILDGIEDPHNLGAIIRSADACGVHGVVIPKHRAVGLTSTVSKTSAGAIEHVPVARVTNLNYAIKDLSDQRVFVMGLDQDAKQDYHKVDFKLPLALVIGGEGKGLSQQVKKNCELLIKIPMVGKINSLNASVAAAVVMQEVLRQRSL